MDINKKHLEDYNKIIDMAKKLKQKKMIDYNSNKINRFEYALHNKQTFLDEIYKKILRLINLIDNNIKPNNESINDTLIDIINYSADFYSYLEYNRRNKYK